MLLSTLSYFCQQHIKDCIFSFAFLFQLFTEPDVGPLWDRLSRIASVSEADNFKERFLR